MKLKAKFGISGSFSRLSGMLIGLAFALLCSLPFVPLDAQTADADAEALLIRDIRMIDFSGAAPAISDGVSVLVRGGNIAAIGADAETEAPDDVRIVEGNNRTILPGLYDMHVHIWDEAELGSYLAHGVTTVRNLSGMPFLLPMRDRVEAGQLAGPRILTSGPILNGSGPNAQPNHQIVDTPEDARAAVRTHFETGYRRIKVYSNLSRASYDAIRDEAAALGMRITGHTPEGVREPGMPQERPFNIAFDELLDDDFETIEHVESIVWHGLRNRQDEDAARALAQRIAAAAVPVDATLVAFANLYRVAESEGAYLSRAGTDLLNPFISAMEAPQYERWSAEDAERAAGQLAFFQTVTRIFQEEGVSIVAGSDSGIFTNIPGVSLHDELDLMVEAGLTPYQVLQTATVNAAQALGEAERVGRIAPGFRADLILVEGDPLADIGVLREPVAIIANGRFMDAEERAALIEASAQTDYDRTAANVLAALAAQGSEVPGQ
jgi:amidohydrolase family protein